jgi:hypothetical protein
MQESDHDQPVAVRHDDVRISYARVTRRQSGISLEDVAAIAILVPRKRHIANLSH